MIWVKLLEPLAIAAALFVGGYLNGQSEERAVWEQKWAAQEKAISDLKTKHLEELRKKESEWASQVKLIDQKGDERVEQLEMVIDSSRAVTERLQHEYEKLAASARRGASSSDARQRAEAEKAASMLADVLRRCETRTDEIARYADELEISYDSCAAYVQSVVSF